MGLLYTGIYEEGMSIKGGRVMHENYTTAREMSSLMDKIYTGQAVDKGAWPGGSTGGAGQSQPHRPHPPLPAFVAWAAQAKGRQ